MCKAFSCAMQWKVHFKEGQSLCEAGNTQAAMSEWRKWQAIDTNNATLYLNIAAAQCKMGCFNNSVRFSPRQLPTDHRLLLLKAFAWQDGIPVMKKGGEYRANGAFQISLAHLWAPHVLIWDIYLICLLKSFPKRCVDNLSLECSWAMPDQHPHWSLISWTVFGGSMKHG